MIPSRHPRSPSIGFGLRQRVDLREEPPLRRELAYGHARTLGLDDLDFELAGVVEELVKWRVEQADRDGHSVHRLKNAEEVTHLDVEQLRKFCFTLVLMLGEDVVLQDHLPLAEEHVLRAAQADALRPELAAERRIVGRVRVRTYAHRAELVGPVQQVVEVTGNLGFDEGHGANDDHPGGTVYRNDVTLVQVDVTNMSDLLLSFDLEFLNSTDAWLAHAAGDNSCVARLAAVRRENALSGVHARQIVRIGLPANENDLATLGLGSHGIGRGEDDFAHRGTRAGVEPLGDHVVLHLLVELRMQQLVELGRIDTQDRFLRADHVFVDHVDRDLQGSARGALADAGLEHPKLALLDRELDVAHVAIGRLELREDSVELLPGCLEPGDGLEVRDGLGDPYARYDVLALGVGEEVAVVLVGAISRVAREAHAGRGGVALVAEHHRLHVDCGAEIVGDSLHLAVVDSTLVHPAGEHGFDGETQLRRTS